jgi:hypothetical protein
MADLHSVIIPNQDSRKQTMHRKITNKRRRITPQAITLSNELLLEIFDFLTLNSLSQCRLVSHSWNIVTSNETLWSKYFDLYFSDIVIKHLTRESFIHNMAIIKLFQPVLRFAFVTQMDDNIDTSSMNQYGFSQMGGEPYVCEDNEWPMCCDKRMSLSIQIDCSSVPYPTPIYRPAKRLHGDLISKQLLQLFVCSTHKYDPDETDDSIRILDRLIEVTVPINTFECNSSNIIGWSSLIESPSRFEAIHVIQKLWKRISMESDDCIEEDFSVARCIKEKMELLNREVICSDLIQWTNQIIAILSQFDANEKWIDTPMSAFEAVPEDKIGGWPALKSKANNSDCICKHSKHVVLQKNVSDTILSCLVKCLNRRCYEYGKLYRSDY